MPSCSGCCAEDTMLWFDSVWGLNFHLPVGKWVAELPDVYFLEKSEFRRNDSRSLLSKCIVYIYVCRQNNTYCPPNSLLIYVYSSPQRIQSSLLLLFIQRHSYYPTQAFSICSVFPLRSSGCTSSAGNLVSLLAILTVSKIDTSCWNRSSSLSRL